MGHPDYDAAWVREALRVHHRYQTEIVERCGLCPWAEGARLGGKVRERVLLQSERVDLRPSLDALSELAADRTVEVAFLVYPRLTLSRLELEDFAATVRTADTARHQLGKVPFVFAVFHPEAEPETDDPERLIPFLRRTPDRTFQLVRVAVLDGVRSLASQGTQFVSTASFEALPTGHVQVPLRERIARTNLATVQRMGVETMRRALDDIRRDRDETYARLREAVRG